MTHTEILAEVMLLLMGVTFLAALGAVGWSVAKTAIRHKRALAREENGDARRTAAGVFLGTVVLLVLSFVFASTKTLAINGQPYANQWWLRVADMFLVSCAVMLLAAVALLLCGRLPQGGGRKAHIAGMPEEGMEL